MTLYSFLQPQQINQSTLETGIFTNPALEEYSKPSIRPRRPAAERSAFEVEREQSRSKSRNSVQLINLGPLDQRPQVIELDQVNAFLKKIIGPFPASFFFIFVFSIHLTEN